MIAVPAVYLCVTVVTVTDVTVNTADWRTESAVVDPVSSAVCTCVL